MISQPNDSQPISRAAWRRTLPTPEPRSTKVWDEWRPVSRKIVLMKRGRSSPYTLSVFVAAEAFDLEGYGARVGLREDLFDPR